FYQIPLLRVYRKHHRSLQGPTSWIKQQVSTSGVKIPIEEERPEDKFENMHSTAVSATHCHHQFIYCIKMSRKKFLKINFENIG
ncbi:hypothetical protein L9F63_011141, partial [Diploptera punctata]